MRISWLAFAAVALLWRSAAEAAPAGFQAGERMTFSLSVGPIPAGRARLSVGLPVRKNGRRLVAVQGDAHSAEWLSFIARLDDDYQVILDADALTPTRVQIVETGVRERRITTDLDGARMALDFVSPKDQHKERRLLPGAPRDPMAALFALRAAPLRAGEVIELLVLDGPALYRAIARVVVRERITREEGPAAAIRIAITAQRIDDRAKPANLPQRHITIWLSDDDRRLPYRVEGDTDLGRASVELTSYSGPRAPPTRPPRLRTRAAQLAVPPSL